MHLAEFNFGYLKHGWDHPAVQDFLNGLERVYQIAAAMPGYVWRVPDDAMERAQTDPDGPFGGNARAASTLSVWTDVASLETFVWNTVHRQFHARKAEWYDAVGNGNLVLWWVPEGYRPSVAEGMARWQHLQAHGDSDAAFGWSYLKEAQLWKTHACAPVAAE
ncbi:MAG: hypothetical protein B7Z10_04905 [Rhodobacterales bacterium 32-66-7]|nr:MAG: hypothetical protein B7Z10_04905 [Rhodobacterales bacterium 32-66-7]